MLIYHFDILRGFASLRPTNTLAWPQIVPIAETHDFLLFSVLLNPHLVLYPPSVQYQRNFWKWAIENMERELPNLQPENCEFEIDERIYEHYLRLLPVSGPTIGSSSSENRNYICGRGIALHQDLPSECYVTHYWPLTPCCHSAGLIDPTQYQTITLLESRRLIESGTTGLRTWRASFTLAQYLTGHPDIVKSKRVLELGCGIGFLGIIIAALQIQSPGSVSDKDDKAGSLYLTDSSDAVLSRCRENFRLLCNLSSRHPDFHIQSLDWFASLDDNQRDTLGSLIHRDIRPDILIGADIVFDPSLIPPLIGVLKCALSQRGGGHFGSQKIALIALTYRNESTIRAFTTQIQEAPLHVMEVPTDSEETAFAGSVDPELGENVTKVYRITA